MFLEDLIFYPSSSFILKLDFYKSNYFLLKIIESIIISSNSHILFSYIGDYKP